jgi:hypothetical protein
MNILQDNETILNYDENKTAVHMNYTILNTIIVKINIVY